MMHEFYKLTAGDAAYDLEIGFEPDMIIVHNLTKWATDATIMKSFHYKGDADGYSYNELCDDAGTNRSISTSNGFTVTSTSSVGRAKSAISAATQASPGVITVASTAAFTSGDHVKLHGIAGMTELNDITFEIVVIDSTTFSLKDLATGNAINTTDYAAYVSSTNDYLVNLSDVSEDTGAYKVTLGTDIVTDSDVLVVEAIQGSTFSFLGDIG